MRRSTVTRRAPCPAHSVSAVRFGRQQLDLRDPFLHTLVDVLGREFGDAYPEVDLGHTAQTWALIMDRLARFAASGQPQPFFPEA